MKISAHNRDIKQELTKLNFLKE